MKLLSLYEPFAGTMSDFTKNFENNDALFNQAKAFWRQLDDVALLIILVLLICGIVGAAYYYYTYNNRPGRHYKPKYWGLFLLGTFVVTFALTLLLEYVMVHPSLSGAFWLELRIAFGNAIYALLLYIIVSILWCNFFPTNACRIFKR